MTTNSLVPTIQPNELAAFAQRAKTRSITSHAIAARLPLTKIVDATIHAAASRSEQTERSYRTAIGAFVSWLDETRGDVAPAQWRPFAEKTNDGARVAWQYNAPSAVLLLVDQSALDAWRDSIADAAPNTVAARVFAVRTFLRVALRDGALAQNQAINMGLRPYVTRQLRDEQPVGRRLNRDEVRALRAAVDTNARKGARDLAMLDVMLFAGLRCDEVCRLRPLNFTLDNGRRWIILRGKGQKTRRIKIHDTLHATLSEWMNKLGAAWNDDRPLFVSVLKGDRVNSHRIDTNDAARVVEELAERAQLGHITPHDLRRTAARNAYDNGAGLIQVQLMLGHADPKTTARYIGADFNDADTATDHIRY
jgi:integrase